MQNLARHKTGIINASVCRPYGTCTRAPLTSGVLRRTENLLIFFFGTIELVNFNHLKRRQCYIFIFIF